MYTYRYSCADRWTDTEMIIVNTKTDTERQVSRQRERYLLRAIDKYLQRERERERERVKVPYIGG